jgi:hypothetical protein
MKLNKMSEPLDNILETSESIITDKLEESINDENLT